MARRSHVLVESQVVWGGPAAGSFLREAVSLAEAGDRVILYLVEDGVFAAVSDGIPELARLVELGSEVWADEHSLGHRALVATRLSPFVRVKAAEALDHAVRQADGRVVIH
jgi:sulfur relay (sulfurtransferase) DsrF/TusC family protein